jgi:rhodanese-related sulfurtransferase
MGISFTKILLILVGAIAIALLINYLQPDGLPLFNEGKSSGIDEKFYSQSPTVDNLENKSNDSVKVDYNKTAVERNKVKIDENLLPQYDYKNDSDLGKNSDADLIESTGKSEDNAGLSNLTTDVFNQPRLISLSQAYELYRNKILFVDGRDSTEYNDAHIAGAVNLPYFFLNEYNSRINLLDKSEPLVTYCEGADCDVSIRLGNELFAKGFRKVFVFFGGWEEWTKAGYPTITAGTNLNLN